MQPKLRIAKAIARATGLSRRAAPHLREEGASER